MFWSLSILFMKMLNRSGPRIEPCGTPDVTCACWDVTPSSTLDSLFSFSKVVF